MITQHSSSSFHTSLSLFHAHTTDNIDQFREIIKEGIDVNYYMTLKESLLQYVIMAENSVNISAFKILLKKSIVKKYPCNLFMIISNKELLLNNYKI